MSFKDENTVALSIEDKAQQSHFLQRGSFARIVKTGQVVEVLEVSDHGVSIVSFRTGGKYFMSNMFLEPVALNS